MATRARLQQRTVVITGATAGVGRALALRFAQSGDRLGLIAQDATTLEAVERELERTGVEVATAAVDVTDAGALFAAAEPLEQRLGKIDVWINDAMETAQIQLSSPGGDVVHGFARTRNRSAS
jgi:short-subunit dehydrogenase